MHKIYNKPDSEVDLGLPGIVLFLTMVLQKFYEMVVKSFKNGG
jgi:hypothetical protein